MPTTTRDVEAELKAARRDIETLAKMAAERAGEAGATAVDLAERKAQQLSDEARKLYDEAVDGGVRARREAEARIRENPLASAGIAFLIGALFAALMGRR